MKLDDLVDAGRVWRVGGGAIACWATMNVRLRFAARSFAITVLSLTFVLVYATLVLVVWNIASSDSSAAVRHQATQLQLLLAVIGLPLTGIQVVTACLIVRLTSRLTEATHTYADASVRQLQYLETTFVRSAADRILVAMEPVTNAFNNIDERDWPERVVLAEQAVSDFWNRILSDLYLLPQTAGERTRAFKRMAELTLSRLKSKQVPSIEGRLAVIGLLGVLRFQLSGLARGEALAEASLLPPTVEDLDTFIEEVPWWPQ